MIRVDARRRWRFATMTALVLVLVLAGPALPVLAQDSGAEARLRKIEAEVRALQRKVFPGDGKTFAPEISAATATTTAATSLAATPLTEMLTRMDAVEAQLARLTAQTEQNTNRIVQLEARAGIGASPPVAGETPAAVPTPSTTATPAAEANIAAMTGGASVAPTPAPKPAAAAVAPKPVATPAPAGPTAQRLAGVRAIEKPQTADPGDDEYSYGYRLWEAKFYPEAAQQLRIFVDKYPRHARISYGRNLLGRALLDDGKPREAASWFLQNYQSDKAGARASDSLLYLGVAMKQLNDTNRACIAIAEFGETYASEAAGRLKSLYDQTRNGIKCPR